MKVLVLTNMYPTKDTPYYGIFVKEQVDKLISMKGASEVTCHFIDGKNAMQKYLLSFFGIYKKVKSFSPDILHLHFGLTMLPLLVLYPWLKYKGIKIVLTTHGGDVVGHYPITRFITNVAIKLSDYIINVSSETNDIVKRKTRNTTYIPCGITAEFFSEKETRSRVIVFPSSPSRHEKNYPRFLRIVEQVKEPFEVAVLENLSREEVANLFRRSAVMLMTSDYEGSPQAVKEAIMCDLPVVSTEVGDVPMLLSNYESCVVSNDEEILADAVTYWLSRETDFSYDDTDKKALNNTTVCQQIIDVYDSVLP